MKLTLPCLVILLAFSACSTRLQVTSSYPTQHEQQLSSLNTYCWADRQGEANVLEKQEPVGGHHIAYDSLVRTTIEADLKEKGFVQADCPAANFQIDYRMGSRDDVAAVDASSASNSPASNSPANNSPASSTPASNTSQPESYGPRWSIGDDHSVTYEGLKKPTDNIIVVRRGTLHIAAFTSQNIMLWHGSAEKLLNDTDDDKTRRASIISSVHALLKGFPPHSR
jgi:hypothetical protein